MSESLREHEHLTSPSGILYRRLIEVNIKKLSTQVLQEFTLSEISDLPEDLQRVSMQYIDVTNDRFGLDQQFWRTTECHQAFRMIIETAIEILPMDDRMGSYEEALRPENERLAFSLFQIPTFSFSYSASTQRAQRKFMGIRKGLFG